MTWVTERKYICLFCREKFQQKALIQKHVLKEHEEMLFSRKEITTVKKDLKK